MGQSCAIMNTLAPIRTEGCRKTLRERREMANIFIEAPQDKVFEDMCDLPGHSKWAAHDIRIEAAEEGPLKVGSVY